MTRIIYIITIILCVWIAQTTPAAPKNLSRTGNRVIAGINADLIMQSDIEHYNRRYKRSHGGESPTKEQALGELLDAQLLRQMAAKDGFKPKESEISTIVEEQIAEFKKVYGSQEKFEKAMREVGYTQEGLRADMRKEVLADLQIQHTMGSHFEISRSDEKEEAKIKESTPAEVHLARLGVVFGEEVNKTREDAREQLNELLGEIKSSGLDFQESIKKFIRESSLQDGTLQLDDFGAKKTTELAKSVVDAIAGKDVKTWTKPIVTGQTVSSFYILEKRDAHSLYYERKYTAAREKVLKEQRKRARVTIIAEDYKNALPAAYRDGEEKKITR